MSDNELNVVSSNDNLTPAPESIYRGKYTVGRFHLTDAFIVEYMKIIHEIEIPDSWVNSNFHDILDIDTRKVMYMECCGILSKSVMNEIRNMVKNITQKYENI